MKKMFLGISLLTGMQLQAQDIPQSQVPSVVVNALQAKFPGAVGLEWEMDGANYKADFDIKTNDHDVWLTPAGVIVRHEEDITANSLPAEVKNAIKKEFGSYSIDDADKITEGTNVTYKVELDKLTGDRKVLYSSNGKLLQHVED